MKVREVLNHMQTDNDKIQVTGIYKHGLVPLYKGEIGVLKEILRVGDTLEKKSWGKINPEWCFLLRDVESIGNGDSNGLYISVKMPDTYKHEDSQGNRLNEYL